MKLINEVKITDQARDHLLKAAEGSVGLRLTIRGGKGCGGSEYDLHPIAEGNVDATDDYIELDTARKLYIPSLDLLKLFGTQIDYIEDDLGNRRLDINNPNEAGRCGCGKSVTF